MRAIAIATLAVAACGHTGPVPGPPAIGPVRHEHMAAESDVAFEVDTGIWIPASRQQWQRTTWDRDVEVIAIEADRVTRARITYAHYQTAWTVSGQPQPTTDTGALDGHTYVVTAGGAGALAITDADGDDVTAGEASALRDELRGFGAADPIAAILRDQPLDLDARFTLDEAVLAELVGGDAPDEYWGQATVIGHTATTVTLGVEVTQRRFDRTDGTQTSNSLRGTLVIDALGKRAVALDLAGTLAVVLKTTRAGHAVDLDGAGRASITWAATTR